MAKISVSIPDELKQQLDTYAQQTGFKRSAAVAHILEAYFTDQVRSPDDVQAYLAQLHEQNPELFPRPDWVEKPKIRRQSIAAGFHERMKSRELNLRSKGNA